MAQQQQKQKQPQDPYAQQAKKLASTVQRLRGWVGSDPSRNAELADALVQVTAYRLLGHAHADAALEAQEAVVLSGKLLAEQGPIGPYTPVPDAVRYFTATVHLAAIQAGVGLPDAAGRTMQAALDWQEQLRRHQSLDDQLPPTTAVWALFVQARAVLAAGEVERANAFADAALDRLVEGGMTNVADSYVPMDVQRLVADTRWAAGRVDEALTHDELAREQFERVVDGRLANPGRLSPALLARLAEPLFGLYRVIGDRLIGGGEVDRGLVVRRSLIETLNGLTKRLGEPATAQLALSLDDLAADLVLAGRVEEAELAAEEARQTAARLTGELAEDVRPKLGLSADRADRRPGLVERLASWPVLDDVQSFAGSTAGVRSARPTAEMEAEMLRLAQARAEAERAEAHRLEKERQARAHEEYVRREAERAEDERKAKEQAAAERRAAEQAATERAQAERLEAQRLAAESEAARQEVKRRREERLEAHRLEEERLAAEQQEAERRVAERQLDAADAERRELERLAAELAELERAEAEQADRERRAVEEAERGRAGAERAEAERAEAERAEAERAEAERAEAERRAVQERQEAERIEAERRAAEEAEQQRVEHERQVAEWLEGERLAHEREDAERRTAEQAERERLERERFERERVERERFERELVERERVERELAERERFEGERFERERVERERFEQERVEREQAERERFERERLEQEQVEREQVEREQVERERVEQEQAAAQALRAEESARVAPTEPTDEAQPSEPATTDEGRAPEPPAPEPTMEAPDELDVAVGEWQAAKAAGERRRARAANERVVELLRPKAEADPETYGPQLIDALEQLSSIRLRTGDIFGARAPSREAKALAKALGL